MHTTVLALTALAVTVVALNVQIPLAPPSGAPSITPSLLSFSIEQDRWTDWVGSTSRNQFFFNTLDNLKQLSGSPPQIRIGANSEDHTNFNSGAVFAQAVFPPPTATVPYPEATNITVGDTYYETARFLPPGTHVTWGVNLGQNNITAAVLEAQSIRNAFASSAVKDAGIVLDFVEIGNEPDLYRNNGLRSNTYNVTQYTQDWIRFAKNVSVAAGITTSSHTKFLGASFAGSSHGAGFSPQAIFAAGILDSQPGSLITTISQHRYSGSFCTGSEGLLQDLMSKDTIRGNLTVFAPDIQAVRAKGLDYVLGETNSYSCHGAPGVSNTAGAALWTLDYALFAPQIGISRVFFHEGIGFKYNLIQPATLTRSTLDASPLPAPLPPHIQPQYYAAIIAAEAIGSSGATRATELVVNDALVAGYAFYEGNSLKRAVFINEKAFTRSSANRTSVTIDLNFTSGGSAPRLMTVKRLQIGHADDTAGLTWGGQTYETDSGRVSGRLSVETTSTRDGLVLQDTEAVLMTFN
ncbi:hypothetical protein HGRIS_003675 [Hohenbuehelia grisea]|uniref:Beta-glucuronidase C-terminal domain-containing protein n=1 Tax=Hohenbuehelia grisea TaxID=104357 RepID=A0ABR3JH45_9AGAR